LIKAAFIAIELAIYTVGVATFVYGLQLKQAYPGFAAPRVRVGTFVDATVTFFVILYLTRRWGWKIAFASAVIGTAATRPRHRALKPVHEMIALASARLALLGFQRLRDAHVRSSHASYFGN
jgi:hypothetical protein